MSLARAGRFYQATVGKKIVMAATGVILFGFVVAHMAGNLQIFLGPEKLNDYARSLRAMPALLWLARLTLAAAVALHMVAAVQLWAWNRAARPRGYARLTAVESSYASRTMLWSGPILAAFVVYHLMHFTFGNAHPDFNHELDVYHNVVTGFRQPPVAIAYMIAMAMLGLHLHHGAWSMFQSLGVGHPRFTPLLKRFASVSAVVLVAGNISIPLAVLAGWLR